ncbi:hypothetical protein RND81_12G233600 [Saponaria officinalis]|uniref:Protein WEAK CHLOROPLAST MOVEMENT UNDER BLUE LIGHT 1-like n=1 Tax=Saponaria officinalis TaxID=3572 RepID=A0AAW1HEL4_SAPOF
MGTEIEVQQVSIAQFEEEPCTNSSSEKSDTRNGVKEHENSVDEQSVVIVEDSKSHSDAPSNGSLNTHFDADSATEASVLDAAKDGEISVQRDIFVQRDISATEASVHDAAKEGEISVHRDTATSVKDARGAVGSGDPVSPSNLTSEYDLNRILIDTTAPFESVKEAVSKFGGIVDWKAHKVQTVQRRKIIEKELQKVQQEIPLYKEQSEIAEQSKIQMLIDLENTKRLIEDLKLNLDRAQTEERQAKQDSELAHLRVEEMEQGIAHEASVAAKTQLEVAKARHEAAIADLESVKDELQKIRKEYETLLIEKNDAEKKAEEAVIASKVVEKTVEELTIELISTKELLQSAHAAHLEAEEHRVGVVMAMDQEKLACETQLRRAEDDLAKLNKQIESAMELKSKLNTASTLLADLKAELAAYMESKISGVDTVENGDGTRSEVRSVVAAANKELKDVKLNIGKATDEVNCLKVATTSLKTELEKEKSELANLRQREGMASIAVSSLEAELERIKSEIAVVLRKEKEARERMTELPKQLQHASREAEEAKSAVELAREELRKAKEEAEQAKAGANMMESRFLAARKEIDAARASERLAVAAIKALQESESSETVNDDEDSPSGVTLSLEEYYALSKRAHEAEEEANMKVADAMSQIEAAKDSESRSLTQLEDANREVEERREALRIAMEKAEKAKEGKLGVEQELRKWREENEQRRKTENSINSPRKSGSQVSDSSLYEQGIKIEKVVDSNSSSVPFGQGLGLKNLEQIANPTGSSQQSTTPKSDDESVNSPKATFGQSNTMKKKKRSLFPRFFMFLARRKPSSKNS